MVETKSIVATMAGRFNMEPAKFEQTLRKTVMTKGSQEECAAFLLVANEYGLNPFTKEIWAFPAKGGGIVPVVSVDGWIKLINNHPKMDGMSFEDVEGGIRCIIHRKDREHPTIVTEYLAECRRPTEPWKTMPKRMLRHKALIQAARIAFGFSGVYDEDEARDIATVPYEVKSSTVKDRYARQLPEAAAEPEPEPPQVVEVPAKKPRKRATKAEKEAEAAAIEAMGDDPVEEPDEDFTNFVKSTGEVIEEGLGSMFEEPKDTGYNPEH